MSWQVYGGKNGCMRAAEGGHGGGQGSNGCWLGRSGREGVGGVGAESGRGVARMRFWQGRNINNNHQGRFAKCI